MLSCIFGQTLLRMKKLFFPLALLFGMAASAQTKEGRVVYERVMQMPARNIQFNGNSETIPARTITNQFELLFSANKSLWQMLANANEGDNSFTTGGGGNVMVMRMGGPSEVAFVDVEAARSVTQREEFDRSFVVTDTLAKLNWKMTEETKTILTYTARKATARRIGTRMQMSFENGEMKRTQVADTSTVVAWFTTDVPVSVGPVYPGNLPGLILQLEMNNGNTVYTAIEVSPKVNTAKIKEPKDGKKMTAAEFQKERQKMMEEMQRNMPNGMQFRTIQQ